MLSTVKSILQIRQKTNAWLQSLQKPQPADDTSLSVNEGLASSEDTDESDTAADAIERLNASLAPRLGRHGTNISRKRMSRHHHHKVPPAN